AASIIQERGRDVYSFSGYFKCVSALFDWCLMGARCSFRLLKRFAELFQRALFDARYIAARDAHLLCDLALGQRRGQAEPVPQADDLALARGKAAGERVVHGVVPVVFLDSGKPIVLAADDILQRERVAVARSEEYTSELQSRF